MTASSFDSQIPDELLSAYLDGVVSASERALVENALRADPEVAWRLDTMRQTVQLLRSLRQVAMPASLSAEAIIATVQAAAQTSAQPNTTHRTFRPAPEASLWQRLLDFWRGGSPMLRNAAVGAFALFLVFSLGSQLMLESSQPFVAEIQSSLVQPPTGTGAGDESVAALARRENVAPTSADMAAETENGTGATSAPSPTLVGFAQTEESAAAPAPAAAAFALPEDATAKSAPPGAAAALVQAETADAGEEAEIVAASGDIAAPETTELSEAQDRAAVGTAALEQARGESGAQAELTGGGEDTTGLDAAIMEGAASVEAAPQPLAMMSQADAEITLPTPTLVATTALSTPTTTDAPTRAPTGTPAPTATATPAAAAIARPADAESARVAPSVGAPAASGQPIASTSWAQLIQWATALAALGFLALWLRSRRSPS